MGKPFDILAEFSRFGAEREMSLNDPSSLAKFTNHVGEAIGAALNDPILLHGQRAEAMFEALLISLGGYRLLKAEDKGKIYPSDNFRVPDFRVVLPDGAQWLIEVKNVFIADPAGQKRRIMHRRYREALEAYAAATGGELRCAIYWARWAVWTLVTPNRLLDERGDLVLDMVTAMQANELGRLGDMTIGTRSPLRLRLVMDPVRTSPIAEDGTALVAVGEVQVFCGDEILKDPVEQEIAWTLMQYGQWEEAGPEPEIEAGRLIAMEFRWEPQRGLNEGFEVIGSLSRMFARYYAEHTIRDRQVVRLRAPLRPNWFGPLAHSDYQGEALPLWRFILQPNYTRPLEGGTG